MADRLSLLWLQSGGCGGCSLSLLGAEAPDLLTALDAAGIDLLWHPSLSEASGSEAQAIIEAVIAGDRGCDIFCLEGAVMRGPDGTGRFHLVPGTGMPMMERIRAIAAAARHVVAVGSCAAWGGITAGGGNAVEASGLAYDGRTPGGLLGKAFRAQGGLPVVNVAGCPIHPDWLVETLHLIARGELDAAQLDEWERPRLYTSHLVHHGCARNEFYEFKASAQLLSQMGCMMEHLGCKGTQARADCNVRPWNGTGSCLHGNYPCINCTAPGFEEPGHGFVETPKIGGIPIGLPTDMPKAWFVALASLSKAATPARLRANATADRPVANPLDRSRT
ncbi:MAG: HupU protein [Rhodospirillales bacterium]|nr:HupU protein [Rhodospirillales bacterium]